jgi:hypothetical protein
MMAILSNRLGRHDRFSAFVNQSMKQSQFYNVLNGILVEQKSK